MFIFISLNTNHPPPLPAAATFYGILDSSYIDSVDWVNKCQALITGGAGIIQLRAKQQTQQQRQALLEAILPLFAAPQAPPLIINDDLHLALKYPDLGLHIGQDDIPVAEARAALGPNRILGLSTHSPTQVDAAISRTDQLSYFAVGPIFATQTKPDYIPVGLKLVQYTAHLRPPIPWFCIGGITRKNVIQVKAHGAERIVVVSDVLCDEDTATAVRTLQ